MKGFSVTDIPRQINGWDCGIYVINYIQCVVNHIDNLDTSWDYVSKKGKAPLFKANAHAKESNTVQNGSSSSSACNTEEKKLIGKKLFNQDDIDSYRTDFKLEIQNYNTCNEWNNNKPISRDNNNYKIVMGLESRCSNDNNIITNVATGRHKRRKLNST